MGTADKLVDLMFTWMEKSERCAEQLRELARELEVLRKKCNGSQCVGNSVSVVGAASLLGAGVATLCTGGLAAPFLGLLGAAYTGVGLTISGVTKLTEHFSSSERTKKAESIKSESKRIKEEFNDLLEQLKAECIKSESKRIKEEFNDLFEQLKAECKAESVNADEDELDQLVMAKFPAAIARRNDQKWTVCDSIELSSSSGPQFPENAPLLNQKQNAFAVVLASVLVVFAFNASGKKAKLLVAEAGKQLIKKIGRTAFKVGGTALKGGGLVAGGVVGLAFALHEAIDSWKERIKNNHVTKTSQSLRDTADSLDEMCLTLMYLLEAIKQEMAQRQREYEEMEEERRKKKKKETPFVRAALLNVHSMTHKTLKILDLIRKDHLQVFFSTETWLQSKTAGGVLKKASPEGFSFFFHASELRGFRGVAIQFSPVLHGIQIQFKNNMKSFEYVATVLEHTKWKEPVLSINLYRPPKKTLKIIHKFVNEFQELLNEVSIKNIIVTGDFNIWVDDKSKTYVTVFDYFLLINGFVCHTNKPTFDRSIHFLDLVLTKNVEVSDVKVRDNDISDHKTVQFNWRPNTVSWHFVL